MSQEDMEVVRQRILLRGRSRRGVEERVALWFPRLAALVARMISGLSPRSRLRQTLVRRTVVWGWDAMNRVDLEAGTALYHPNVQSVYGPGMASLGFAETQGLEERRRNLAEVYAETREMHFDPVELIDLGDGRLLVIGRMRGSGLRSGAPFDSEWANLWTVSAGVVIRDQVFMSHREALEAAGLRE